MKRHSDTYMMHQTVAPKSIPTVTCGDIHINKGFYFGGAPRIRSANCISFIMRVTRFAWIAHKLASSNNDTRYASADSCNARRALACHLRSALKSRVTSLT